MIGLRRRFEEVFAWRGAWGARGFAFTLGAVAALGHVPFALSALTPVGLAAAMLLLVSAPTAFSAAAVGWSFGFGYFVVALHWLVEPFLVDVARHGWMAPFALVFMASGLALFWAAAFGIAGWLRVANARPFCLVVTLPVFEWLRSTILSGFPWALPAYAWSETPLIHAAALVGPHGLTTLTVLLAAGLTMAIRLERPLAWALVGAVPLATVAGLAWSQAQRVLIEPDEAPVVRLVQPNAPQDQKWDPDRAVAFVNRQIALTAERPAPDLIVWPETAIPWTLADAGPILERASEAAGGMPLILGLIRVAGLEAYNSLAVIGPHGEVLDVYDKHHLVPFGEYIPLGRFARLIGLRSFAAKDGYGYTAGTGPRRLDLGWLGRPLPLICYEAIFPAEVGSGERPDWLLQITNDAWFGTFSGPYQHLAQARFRAVEQGLPMIRVANTGVSAVIDSTGHIVASLPLGQGGYVDAALPPVSPPTVYSRTGDLPVIAALLAALVALALSRKAR
jgi:apolipoprotein N-acyltransferase